MSRRWRRGLARQPLRDEKDRARLERLIAEAQAEDARRSLISPRDTRSYGDEKKANKGSGQGFTVR